MNLGLFARSESTGLSAMSWDAYRNLQPSHTLVIDVDHPQQMHLDRFPDSFVVNPKHPAEFEVAVKHLLTQIDTLLVLETPYNPLVYSWAREAGVYTVCVAMPEYDIPDRWNADLVINPSDYLHHRIPISTSSRIFPWPVDLSTITYRPRTHIDRWLHIVGQPCANDRNGTQLVIDAFRQLPHRQLLIRSQVPIKVKGNPSNIEVAVGNVDNMSDLYQDGDALIYPRRYAGNSLPMHEAAAAGLPLVCLNRQPERNWTLAIAQIPAHVKREWAVRKSSRFDVGPRDNSASNLDIYDADVRDVISVIERISDSDVLVKRLSNHSRMRAESISWEALGEKWRSILTPVRV